MNKKKIAIIISIIIITLLFIFSVIFALININNVNIMNGIYIGGIDISGMTKEDALSFVSEKLNLKENESIKIILPQNNEEFIKISDLNIKYDISSTINKAYNIGRSDNIFKNNYDILKLYLNRKNINLDIDIDETTLDLLISDLSSNLQDSYLRK